MRFIPLAVEAERKEPESMMLMADMGPAWRMERAVPLKPGKMPSLTSGKPTLVAGSRVAMR